MCSDLAEDASGLGGHCSPLAGAFSLRLPGMTQRLMACDDESFPAEYAISCDLIVGQPELRVTSGPMESEAGEDVLVSLDGTVPITPRLP